jgi:1,4-alpha-glucan branching enzyme
MALDKNLVLTDGEVAEINNNSLKDPFSCLGMHGSDKGVTVRTVQYGATKVELINRSNGKVVGELNRVGDTAIFTAKFPRRKNVFSYNLSITFDNGHTKITADPYSFLPQISEEDLYLFNQGNNHYIYNQMGAHKKEIDGVSGVYFSIWAPSAQRVSVVAGFNHYDGRQHPMRMIGSSGVWELFIPGIENGEVYKFEIKKSNGDLVLKTDPYGYSQEPFPNHGSIVTDISTHEWNDSEWLETRKNTDWENAPMAIYELHLGSWMKSGPDEEGDYHSYSKIGELLVPYLKEMNYTHVELMPVQEHPFVPSWGYQVGGFYAVNHRFGSASDFQGLVDHLHQNGIGVILDWVPGHFPKDEHILSFFDGTHLYEHEDPREGEHVDWGTLIFNYGRHEVRNFLVANAVYWVEKYHIDGLRIDAVASMLYRNYSREDGDWIPNKYGSWENFEAINFLQNVNNTIHTNFPGVVTIAEESTSFPGVTAPVERGGLGFDFKWNMGWMHDTLDFFEYSPIHRKHHQNDLTFTMMYAFTEKFMSVLSHDEVVHGKKSLLEKMPGDDWQKFANLRMLYGWMLGHPGKKLVFQGGEFGMKNEWFEKREIDWFLLDESVNGVYHTRLKRMVKEMNDLYIKSPSLWQNDYDPAGFEWVDHNDLDNSVMAFTRKQLNGGENLLFVFNMTEIIRDGYRLGIHQQGHYEEIFNSNAEIYGGEGTGNFGGINSEAFASQGKSHSINLNLPPLSCSIFRIH